MQIHGKGLLAALLLIAACAGASSAGVAATGGAAEGRWRGPDGEWLPFTTHEEVLDFLTTAEVVSQKEIPEGINHFSKVLLRKDGVEAHAIFRYVDERRTSAASGRDVHLGLHDSDIYERAAYEMSRLLGIDNVPPCTERKLGGARGTIQLWIENAKSGKEVKKSGDRAPVPLVWARQRQTMRLFDALIYNTDRNQGNYLVDEDWKLWFIDHTRAFYPSPRIPELERISWCSRSVWERLQALDRETIERQFDYLGRPQIVTLMERHEALVAYLEDRITQHGENVVLF